MHVTCIHGHKTTPPLLIQLCGQQCQKVSLELGGKSPLIIFGDCDFDKAVRQASEIKVLPWFLSLLCSHNTLPWFLRKQGL